MKVRNMVSNRGNKVANQFIITTEEGTYFQSYDSIIAFVPCSGVKTLRDAFKWNCSTTTGKYLNQFLGEEIKETRRKINAGIYELANLNNMGEIR